MQAEARANRVNAIQARTMGKGQRSLGGRQSTHEVAVPPGVVRRIMVRMEAYVKNKAVDFLGVITQAHPADVMMDGKQLCVSCMRMSNLRSELVQHFISQWNERWDRSCGQSLSP